MSSTSAVPTLRNGDLPLREWVTPDAFAACHLELAEFPLPLVCLAMAAMFPGTPAALATTDRLDGQVWLPAPAHAIVVHVTEHDPARGTVVLPLPLGGSWSASLPVPVTTAADVAVMCRRLLDDGYVSLLAGDQRQSALSAVQALGYRHGYDAAAWWEQDALGGSATGGVAATARTVGQGIDDGDPAILNCLPTTPPADGEHGQGELWQQLRDAYHDGFAQGGTDHIGQYYHTALS